MRSKHTPIIIKEKPDFSKSQVKKRKTLHANLTRITQTAAFNFAIKMTLKKFPNQEISAKPIQKNVPITKKMKKKQEKNRQQNKKQNKKEDTVRKLYILIQSPQIFGSRNS